MRWNLFTNEQTHNNQQKFYCIEKLAYRYRFSVQNHFSFCDSKKSGYLLMHPGTYLCIRVLIKKKNTEKIVLFWQKIILFVWQFVYFSMKRKMSHKKGCFAREGGTTTSMHGVKRLPGSQ